MIDADTITDAAADRGREEQVKKDREEHERLMKVRREQKEKTILAARLASAVVDFPVSAEQLTTILRIAEIVGAKP